MPDIIDLIKSRRTVKNFLSKYVSWENLSKVLDAGRHAPSCGNIQNWKFIVVINPDQKVDLAKATYEQYDIAMASALIVVCGEPEKAERYFGVRGERLYTVQNCAAAIENMLLEAHSLGLGAAWIGAFDEDTVKSICSIPQEIRPQAIVAVGYPREIPNKPPKFPLEAVVYFHKWRGKARDMAKYMNDYATIIARKAAAAKEKMQELSQTIVDKAKKTVGEKE